MDLVGEISDAHHEPKMLPRALKICGVIMAAAALYLVLFKVPGGLFLHNYPKVLFWLYYGILISVVIFGFMEASVGFWVSSKPVERHAVGMAILWVSVLPLVLVGSLGGFAFVAPK